MDSSCEVWTSNYKDTSKRKNVAQLIEKRAPNGEEVKVENQQKFLHRSTGTTLNRNPWPHQVKSGLKPGTPGTRFGGFRRPVNNASEKRGSRRGRRAVRRENQRGTELPDHVPPHGSRSRLAHASSSLQNNAVAAGRACQR